jgi:ATP-dependent Clp protease protease subunit
MNKLYRDEEEPKDEQLGDKKDRFNEEFYYKILNKNRYILLYDIIENCSADIIVSKIKAMNYLDSKQTIILEINSPGGDLSCGTSIINAIEQSKAPIHTIISGQCCSMAAMISIIGKKRSMYYNSYWMNHPLSEGQADYLQFIKDRTKFLIHLDKMTENLLKKYTKLTKKDLMKISTGELWLSAEESLQKGVIDYIIK